VRSGPGKTAKNKKKKSTVVSSKKKSTVMSPIRRRIEKTQPIQWTERPTGALVAVNSLWPVHPVVDTNLLGMVFGSGVANSRVGLHSLV
jgi:hypothetical protein